MIGELVWYILTTHDHHQRKVRNTVDLIHVFIPGTTVCKHLYIASVARKYFTWPMKQLRSMESIRLCPPLWSDGLAGKWMRLAHLSNNSVYISPLLGDIGYVDLHVIHVFHHIEIQTKPDPQIILQASPSSLPQFNWTASTHSSRWQRNVIVWLSFGPVTDTYKFKVILVQHYVDDVIHICR